MRIEEAGAAEGWAHALIRQPVESLIEQAEAMTLAAFGATVTYSRKVFIPLTHLCRDVCHYCTFAKAPRHAGAPYLSIEQVLEIARAGEAAGCREALFTLGDRPEDRYTVARNGLAALGHDTTLSYLREAAAAVLAETSLLPHLNPGIMSDADLAMLRPVAASMGLMLESTAARLCEKGGPHHGSPDKVPAVRLEAIEAAGRARVPFTTGLLIGIGETRMERIEALLAIRDAHARHGHIQEVIIQNFRAKPDTRMADHAEPPLEEHLWTVAAARLILGPDMTIQAPPNLQPDGLAALMRAGVNDWGGVSPVTPDHVNPEAPWPHLMALSAATTAAGRVLTERLAVGPVYAKEPERWLEPDIALKVRRAVDARGLPIVERWRAGAGEAPPLLPLAGETLSAKRIDAILDKATAGQGLDESEIVALFKATGPDVRRVMDAADALRREAVGDAVTYVINRNINYTNICTYKCGFCAFSKGTAKALRGPAYRLDLDEVGRRAAEAQARGATEVCLQGGIHPDYDGHTYLSIAKAVRDAAPGIHVHAFSPLEITHGASTLGMGLEPYLSMLKEAGLSTLPGTAAEILHEEVRAIICPDKLSADEWVAVMRAAHRVGLKSTATIMFGHVDDYRHWARHLRVVRDLQAETGGFTELVPLPFVHMEAPMWRKGKARSGPSFREAMLMQAVARIALHGAIPNIQASWVKLGEEGVIAALGAGVNDLGGVLMDESITRAAGGAHGQFFDVERMHRTAEAAGRFARQRTTLYGMVKQEVAA
ncbi:FO synthase [Sphingobium sp. TomTYG75]